MFRHTTSVNTFPDVHRMQLERISGWLSGVWLRGTQPEPTEGGQEGYPGSPGLRHLLTVGQRLQEQEGESSQHQGKGPVGHGPSSCPLSSELWSTQNLASS